MPASFFLTASFRLSPLCRLSRIFSSLWLTPALLARRQRVQPAWEKKTASTDRHAPPLPFSSPTSPFLSLQLVLLPSVSVTLRVPVVFYCAPSRSASIPSLSPFLSACLSQRSLSDITLVLPWETRRTARRSRRTMSIFPWYVRCGMEGARNVPADVQRMIIDVHRMTRKQGNRTRKRMTMRAKKSGQGATGGIDGTGEIAAEI